MHTDSLTGHGSTRRLCNNHGTRGTGICVDLGSISKIFDHYKLFTKGLVLNAIQSQVLSLEAGAFT